MPRTPDSKSKALEVNPDVKDKIFSFEHARKNCDAILFGSSQRNAILCNYFHVEIRKFPDNLEENVVEPFTFPLCVKSST